MFENIVFGDVRKKEFKFVAQQTTTGAEAGDGKVWWEEYVHVIPVDTTDKERIGIPYLYPYENISVGSYKSGDAVNQYLGLVYDAMERVDGAKAKSNRSKYNKEKYKGTENDDIQYKIILNPKLCNDPNVQDQALFTGAKSKKTTREKKVKEQDGTKQKRNTLYNKSAGSIYEICTKVMYMLYYGSNAIERYNREKAARTQNDAYYKMMGQATRFLWGEYEPNQWHRGVDFYFGRGAEVRSLWSGLVIEYVDRPHRTSIFCGDLSKKEEGFTVTYCHMEKLPIVKTKHRWIEAGTVIGKEDGYSHGQKAPWNDHTRFPSHTHIEINKGYYTGDINIPWSNAVEENDEEKKVNDPYNLSNKRLNLTDFKLEDHISQNPYGYFLQRINDWPALCNNKQWE